MTLDDLLTSCKDQQAKLSMLNQSHDPVLWNQLSLELLNDLSHAKGPRADEFIECVARSVVFLKPGLERRDAIRKLFVEALTGDITYQSRLGSIAEFLTWSVNKEKRRELRLSLPQLEKGKNYGSGLVSAWHVLENDRDWY
jgi:hypothetical protein